MRTSIRATINRLHKIYERVEGYLINAEDAKTRDENQINELGNEMDAIRDAIDALEDIK